MNADELSYMIGLGVALGCAAFLGHQIPQRVSIKQAASIIGKLGRQTQLRTQAEKTQRVHAELRKGLGK